MRIGHAFSRLRLRHRTDAGAQQAQAVGQYLRPQRSQAVVQLAAGFLLADLDALRQQHRADIQPGFHLHQAHPGLGIAGLDRALDWRRATPARQQRGMHVPAAMGWHSQHRIGQN